VKDEKITIPKISSLGSSLQILMILQDQQLFFNSGKMRTLWPILIFLVSIMGRTVVLSLPLINSRSIQLPNIQIPSSIMNIVAQKMGLIDFIANFVRGLRATFLGEPDNPR
jgi:hypothetical protein